jgi:aconitate decarboxylase
VLGVRYADLPENVVDLSRDIVLDGLAVTMAGATEPMGLGRLVIDYTRDMGGNPQASVIAGGFKTSMPAAAFANGTMAHALDFDNTWYPLNHPTSPTLPAILAIAEHRGLGGSAIIEALVTAFEVQGRLRLAATGMDTGSGFHKPGMTGIMGAVAAAVRLLGLDRKQALMAFGIAGSRAGSIAKNTGSMTKSSHSGHAARMGVECALLAQRGFTGTNDVFGPGGFFDTFMPGRAEPQRLVEAFGAPFRMFDPGVGFKKHPSNYFTHRPIDAALALRRDHRIDPAQIERVEVTFPRFEYINRPQPATGLDGKFSVQYTSPVALLDGEITVDSFANERRFAADVVRLLPRVELRFDDSIPADFDSMHVVVKVALSDGRSFEQRVDKLTGWCGIPLTREERLRKFYSCALRVLDRAKADRLIALVDQLERLRDIAPIADIVRTPCA